MCRPSERKWLNCFVGCWRMNTLGTSWRGMMPPVCRLQKKTTGAYDFDTWNVLTSRATLSLLEQIRIWCSTFGVLSDIGLMRPRRLLGFSSRSGHQVVPEQYAAQQDSFVLSVLAPVDGRRTSPNAEEEKRRHSPMWFNWAGASVWGSQVAETLLRLLLEFHTVPHRTDQGQRASCVNEAKV